MQADLAGQGAAAVDQGAAELARLPPAGIGAVVAQGDQQGESGADEGDRQVGYGQPTLVEDDVEHGHQDVPRQEHGQGAAKERA